MTVLAALLAGAAVWCAVPVPAVARVRSLSSGPRAARSAPSPATLATVLTPFAALVVLGPVLGLAVALVATPLVRSTVAGLATAASRRREAQLRAQLPAALDLLVAVLASGRPAVTAFEVVSEVVPAPLGPDLAHVAARLSSGADVAAVWDTLVRHPVLGPLGRAFRRAERSGAPVAAVLAAAGEDVRRVRAGEARERARGVGVRTAAPLGACFLPAFFLVGIVPALLGIGSGLDLLP